MLNKRSQDLLKIDIDKLLNDKYVIVKKAIKILFILSIGFYINYNYVITDISIEKRDEIKSEQKIYQSPEYKVLKQQINFYQNRVDVKLKELQQLDNKTTSGPMSQWLNETLINKKQQQIDFNMNKLEIKKLELKQYMKKR